MTADIISFEAYRVRRLGAADTNLVLSRGEVFRYADLLLRTPERVVFAAFVDSRPETPQQWWNQIASEWPLLADSTARKCRESMEAAG